MEKTTHDLRASSLKTTPQTLRTPKRVIKFLTLAAAHVIGPITRDCNIMGFTKGQFSSIDMIDHVLNFTGKANITLTMWSANDAGIFRLVNMRSSGKIGQIRLVMDPSFFARKPEFYQTLVDNFGSEEIRTLNCHAKFATISNNDWSIAIRTSMNLTHNPRLEIFEITDSLEICGFFKNLVDEIFDFKSINNFVRGRNGLLDCVMKNDKGNTHSLPIREGDMFSVLEDISIDLDEIKITI